MSYRWWVWLHVTGAFAFVAAHGVSVAVAFAIRRQRDAARVSALLGLSSSAITYMYVGLLVLIGAGVVAGFQLHAWGAGWIWTAIAVLVVTIGFMYAVATPYYRKVRTVTDAILDGSQAVTEEQFADLVSSRRPFLLAVVGAAALLVILWRMLLKPF